MVYCPAPDPVFKRCFGVKAADAATGDLLWTFLVSRGQSHPNPIWFEDGVLYCGPWGRYYIPCKRCPGPAALPVPRSIRSGEIDAANGVRSGRLRDWEGPGAATPGEPTKELSKEEEGMHKFIGLIALLVLAATVACGMSVEDYAEECSELREYSQYASMSTIFWSSNPEEALDFAEAEGDFDDSEDALEDWKALSPPGELKDYHDAHTEIIELSIYTFQKLTDLSDELDDLRDDRDDARRSEGGDFDDQIEDLVDELDDLRDDRDNARRSEREDLDNQIEDLVDELDDLRDDRGRRP